MDGPAAEQAARIDALADRVWNHQLATDAFRQLRAGRSIERLRTGSTEEAHEDAAIGRAVLAELDAFPKIRLTSDQRATVGLLRFLATSWIEAAEHHLLTFTVTPYGSMALTSLLGGLFTPFAFAEVADVVRYLSLMADYRDGVREMERHLAAQVAAGIRLPRPAIPSVRETIQRGRAASLAKLRPAPQRLDRLGATEVRQLQDGVEGLLGEITSSFDDLLAELGEAYATAAPADVGQEQYPRGLDNYRRLIRLHTTTDLSPEQIQQIGRDQVAMLSEDMAKVRADLGFVGSQADFHQAIAMDRRFFARDASGVEACYRKHLRALQPRLPRMFTSLPSAPFDVRRLPEELEAGMTFGYYQPPTAQQPAGQYLFNGSSLDQRSMLGAAALIFHELAPGHHFHLARQSSNSSLHPLRRETLELNSFNEGWAEYAAGLCGELGLYDDPYDRYGRLAHERFTAVRLVVDTGMNALGWSLARAREYMREHAVGSDLQVETETLRYATDLPGQALAYRVGFLAFQRMRAQAERAFGRRFDIREFHEVLLAPGALPLPVVDDNVNAWISSTVDCG